MSVLKNIFKKPDNRLKELRKAKGLTQAELAKILNTNQSQYGKYENGKTKLSLENSKILANYFGVSTPYLLGLDETPTLKDSDSTQDNLELSNLTLFQKISLNQDASNAFEDIIYSIHLLSERDDKHSKLYIRSVTNYILMIISSKSSSLGNKSPFHRTEKAEFEYEYQKYILPFEKAVLKIEVNLKEEKSID
ncbi:helix-turn-helix domain-containing protein [Streptococcus sp. FSL R7-0212]|uniref:helix-turn-helix domain-containing protein n=1 Tax=Streptococcus sp. FSL R7-0212 TaxID=2921726 RepID=UPI0030F5DD71